MNKKIILVLITLFVVLSSLSVLSDKYPVHVRPLNGGFVQPLTQFNYTFNFTSDFACSNVLSSVKPIITTNNYGDGFSEMDISSLTIPPSYVCEYINNASQPVKHNITDGLFKRVLADEIIANDWTDVLISTSQVSGYVGDNTSFNQTLTNSLYAPLGGGNSSWNQTLADSLYADISVVDTDTIWDINTTSLQNQSGTLGVKQSWLDSIYAKLTDIFSGSWNDLTNVPAGFADSVDNDTTYSHLSNFTDDLGNRGYTHLSNFTDDLGHIEDNTTWNQGLANTLYSLASWNKTYADTLYADISVVDTDTNESTRVNNLVASDCTAGTLVIGVQANGTVLCATDVSNVYTHLSNFTDDLGHIEDNSSWNESYANSLYADISVVDTDTNCSTAGSCNSISYLNYANNGELNVSGKITSGNGSFFSNSQGATFAWKDFANVVDYAFAQIATGQTTINHPTGNTTTFTSNSSTVLAYITDALFYSVLNFQTAGNVTGTYIKGDGSLLTNLPAGGNPFDQSLNTTDNVIFSSVNTTNIYVENGSIANPSIAFAEATGTGLSYLLDGGNDILIVSINKSPKVMFDSNTVRVINGDFDVDGTDYGLTWKSTDMGIKSSDTPSNYIYIENQAGNKVINISEDGNITANAYFGDGSQLTGVSGGVNCNSTGACTEGDILYKNYNNSAGDLNMTGILTINDRLQLQYSEGFGISAIGSTGFLNTSHYNILFNPLSGSMSLNSADALSVSVLGDTKLRLEPNKIETYYPLGLPNGSSSSPSFTWSEFGYNDGCWMWNDDGDDIMSCGIDTVPIFSLFTDGATDGGIVYHQLGTGAGSNSHSISYETETSVTQREILCYGEGDAGTDTYRYRCDSNAGNLMFSSDESGDMNISGSYYGDGSQLTGVSGGNSSWNESYANGLYSPLNYGDDWNKTYADSLYADISVIDTDTNETVRFNNLANTDCASNTVALGTYTNGTVMCTTQPVALMNTANTGNLEITGNFTNNGGNFYYDGTYWVFS